MFFIQSRYMSLKTMKHLGMILSSYKLPISHHHLKKMCVCVFFLMNLHANEPVKYHQPSMRLG